MMKKFSFKIEKRIPDKLGRAGVIHTQNGKIKTPAFVVVGTKATVKALNPEQIKSLGAQVVLANTYHLYLQPGTKVIKKGGGFPKFMNWSGPTMTDSGGFQVFSLGGAFGKGGVSKFSAGIEVKSSDKEVSPLAVIDEEGVNFKSHLDGSLHRLTPKKSMQIQHDLGADIIFAFDECTSPQVSYEYQKTAMERTHRWAKISLTEHKKLNKKQKNHQALFGIVQGGNFSDLRKESAKFISSLDFDGFGIGGSFTKKDIDKTVALVNLNLPEDKPRHLLGIGEVLDIFAGVENGIDTFDCVAPTREARNGTLQTKLGKINIANAKYKNDFKPIEKDCDCYTCQSFSRAYLAHLFRANEMLAGTLASIHNLRFFVRLTEDIRKSIIKGNYFEFKKTFLKK